jgi:hypothetical protein
MRLVAFSPRLAGPATELLGEPAIRIYHDNALSKEPGCGRTPWHHDAQHFPFATLQAVTAWIPVTAIPAYMDPLALAPALMCVTWSPICHSTRSERHMTQLSHVVSSRVMWLSMRARSPSARSPSTRRCASTPLGPIGPRSRAERCPPPTTPTVLAFSNRRPWSAAVGGTFCPVSSQGVWPYRRSIRSLQVARASVWSRAFRWDCSAWSHPSHRFVSGARIIAASVAGLPVRASSRHRPIRISAPPRGHTGMHARLSGACQAGTRGRRGPSVAVRGTADGAHRPSWRPDAVRYMSVDTATRRSTAPHGDT